MSAGVKFDLGAKFVLIGAVATQQSNRALAMYNAGIRNLHIPGHYFGFKVQDLPSAVNAFQTLDFKGFTVSMPYKQEVVSLVDRLSEDARVIGAVNTVVNDHGVLYGHNTDWIGAINALKAKTGLYEKKVVLIGAGGAARAIAFGLHKEQCKVTVLNRTESKAREIACQYNFEYGPFALLDQIKDFDILINATSVGAEDNLTKKKVPLKCLVPGQYILDIVADPSHTDLVLEGKKKGCSVITGLEMLIFQAIEQFRLFFGNTPSYQSLKQGYLRCKTP